MELIFHPRVQDDLLAILDDYDQRSEVAGDRLFAEFQEAIAEIKERPLKFHRLDESHRRCHLRRFPYHLVFEVVGTEIRVTVLRHHQRHPKFGLGRKWR